MVRPTEDVIRDWRHDDPYAFDTKVKIVGIDLPFWDVAAIAVKIGVVWIVMGAIGYVLIRAFA